MHISVKLKIALQKIGSKLSLLTDENHIEEIVTIQNENRFIEIIKEKEQTVLWLSLSEYGISLGSITTTDSELIAEISHTFLEKAIAIEDIYKGAYGFQYPMNIKKGLKGREILYALAWETVISHYKKSNPPLLKMVEISEKLKDINSLKSLIPFTSVHRLCFSKTFQVREDDLPCIYYQASEPTNKQIIISTYTGEQLAHGDVDTMIEKFVLMIENYA